MKKLGKNLYEVINITRYEKGHIVGKMEVNLKDYDYEEINNISKSYEYKDFFEIEEEYREDTGQILAEFISETYFLDCETERYKTIDGVNHWLSSISRELKVL